MCDHINNTWAYGVNIKKYTKLILAIVFIWALLPLATITDVWLYSRPQTANMIVYEVDSIEAGLLKQNIIEATMITFGMILVFLLYYKDIKRG